jgi:hypothetical protein
MMGVQGNGKIVESCTGPQTENLVLFATSWHIMQERMIVVGHTCLSDYKYWAASRLNNAPSR